MLAVPEEQREAIRRLYAEERHPLLFEPLCPIRKLQPDEAEESDEVEEIVLRNEVATILREELNKLPLKELCALRGRLLEKVSLAQIARDLSITPQAAAYRFKRGLQKLRKNPRLALLCQSH